MRHHLSPFRLATLLAFLASLIAVPNAAQGQHEECAEPDVPSLAFLSEQVEGRIVFIRHADREGRQDRLSCRGLKRALQLGRQLAANPPVLIYTTDTERTRVTARLVAATAGVPPDSIKCYAEFDHAALETARDSLPEDDWMLVVGHSYSLDDLIEGLGGPTITPIRSNEYDRLFVLVPDGTGYELRPPSRY